MIKLRFLTITVILLTLFSCSKKNDNDITYKSNKTHAKDLNFTNEVVIFDQSGKFSVTVLLKTNSKDELNSITKYYEESELELYSSISKEHLPQVPPAKASTASPTELEKLKMTRNKIIIEYKDVNIGSNKGFAIRNNNVFIPKKTTVTGTVTQQHVLPECTSYYVWNKPTSVDVNLYDQYWDGSDWAINAYYFLPVDQGHLFTGPYAFRNLYIVGGGTFYLDVVIYEY